MIGKSAAIRVVGADRVLGTLAHLRVQLDLTTEACCAVAGRNLLDLAQGQHAAHVCAWRYRDALKKLRTRTEMQRREYWQP